MLRTQCCGKCKILDRTTNHPWLMVGWSVSVLGGPSINNLLRAWNQLKWSKEAIEIRVLLRHKYKRTHDISESSVQFHLEIFSAKPEEPIGRQTDHRWWDLGSPSGFMGRIWRPGDHISTALCTWLCYIEVPLYRPIIWLVIFYPGRIEVIKNETQLYGFYSTSASPPQEVMHENLMSCDLTVKCDQKYVIFKHFVVSDIKNDFCKTAYR